MGSIFSKPKPTPAPEPKPDPVPTPDQTKPVDPTPVPTSPPTVIPTPDPAKPEPVPMPEPVEPTPQPTNTGTDTGIPQPTPVPTSPAEPTKPEPAEEPKPEPPAPVVEPASPEQPARPPAVVVREDIRKMSREAVDRFFAAVDRMMVNKDGVPGTSEFFRCASYHGEPAPYYCQHGRETFPGWHRVYLMDFEKALQKADMELGNDGDVSLPYWDWADLSEMGNGLPDVIAERFTGWPEGFWPPELEGQAMTSRLRRSTDRRIAQELRSWGVAEQARDCLLATEHWAHASTRFSGRYPSLETPHNSIHVIVGGNGGNMGSVAWAAYDIAFWLHHCNVDRLYEAYLAIEPDSADEFANFQATQPRNRFTETFEPFRKEDGSPYGPVDTFDTKGLGYRYASLPEAPQGNLLMEAPTVVLFPGVKVQEFESKCYQIHVFLVAKAEEAGWVAPAGQSAIDYDSPHYAGGQGIFGRGSECENCLERPPTDIVIDVSKALRALKLSRHDAVVKVYIAETTEVTDALLTVADTPLPEPVLTGPLFAQEDAEATTDAAEVAALQRYLARFGYYTGAAEDGDFGEVTKQAVLDFQAAHPDGLETDGVVGPLTRAAMRKKRCHNVDPFAKNDVVDEASAKDSFKYADKKALTYWVGPQPGYLKAADVAAAVAKACAEWAGASALELSAAAAEAEADIVFRWVKFEAADNVLRFDGAGGALGRGGEGFVEFDCAERWATDPARYSDMADPATWFRGQPVVSLYYTALHELGHALGLSHSPSPADVMSPFYNPKLEHLSDNDRSRLAELWGSK